MTFSVNQSRYTGEGGYEGTPNLAGKGKPLCFGTFLRVKPLCIDEELQIYQYQDEALGDDTDLLAVYYNGKFLWRFNLTCDLFSDELRMYPPEDLRTYLPEEFQYRYISDEHNGLFRINFRNDGLILCDVKGPSYFLGSC